MGQHGGRLGLAKEPPAELSRENRLRTLDLQGDRAAKLRVVGKIDDAETTPPQLADDLKSVDVPHGLVRIMGWLAAAWPNLFQQPETALGAAESLGSRPVQVGARGDLIRGNLPREERFSVIGQPSSQLFVAIEIRGRHPKCSTPPRAARRPVARACGPRPRCVPGARRSPRTTGARDDASR